METDTSFDQIYDELFPSIYRFVRLKVPISDVDDVTAEILVRVWRSLSSFKSKSSLKSWALKIANNQVADYYRARKNVSILPLSDELLELSSNYNSSQDFIEFVVVKHALEQLTDTQTTAIQLRLIEGFSSIEAAQLLNMTPQAVDSLLYRAKKSFRQAYEQGTQEVMKHDRK